MTRRGQLVLVAAVVVAVAMVPLVLAYMQLGYHADVRAGGAHDDPTAGALTVLERAVHEASADIPGQYRWGERDAAVQTVRSRIGPQISTVEAARVEEGIYRNVSYNRSHASGRANATCPSGPNRQFGSCEAIDGVVVQDRGGWTHVLGIAFDVETTGEHHRTELTTVVSG